MSTAAHPSSRAYALDRDAQDPLRAYREEFLFPQPPPGAHTIYLCGNSLGLQPRAVRAAVNDELDHWAQYAVEGHFKGELPWMYYHRYLVPQTAHVVGAHEDEVVVMNTLTTNLHLLLVSFYRPQGSRYRIVMEAGAFPSDQYALESQVRWHGFDPDDAIIEVAPRPGEVTLRTEDIVEAIAQAGDSLAVVLFGGVNYFTGQFFDLPAITAAAHQVGAYAGFDLAHAAGNLPLQLHDWDVDFATWCSYKYLNSGPGGPSGIFVHHRHGQNSDLPRFAGWWGHHEAERFQMRKGFQPMPGAAGWQLSNAQVLGFAAHRVSLDLFAQATMPALRAKSEQLTAYLAWWIDQLRAQGAPLRVLTPSDPAQRGCQLSLYLESGGKGVYDQLTRQGVFCDWREDNLFGATGGVIRVAPTPLYNTFEEVYHFARLLAESFGLAQ